MLLEKTLLFFLGGGGYVLVELLYRGRSHVTMFLAGGTAFLLLGRLEEVRPRLPGLLRALVGAGIITLVELFFGLVFNRDYRVWDYRGLPGNFLGQICPRFFLLWVGLAWAAGRVYCNALSCLERVAPQGPGVEGTPGE